MLRGLIYLLADQKPSLLSHIQKRYGHAGKNLFEDVNAWTVLSEIFANIAEGSGLDRIYLIIDALDECEKYLTKLVKLVVRTSSLSSRVKWIVSSRNTPEIERHLNFDNSRMGLSPELKHNAECVSQAIDADIDDKSIAARVLTIR